MAWNPPPITRIARADKKQDKTFPSFYGLGWLRSSSTMIVGRFMQSSVHELKLPPAVRAGSDHRLIQARQLGSSPDGGGNAKKDSKPPPSTLCQVNNHPNYRLKRAKSRFESIATTGTSKWINPKPAKTYNTPRMEKAPTLVKYYQTVLEHGISVVSNENPARSNDGTSSGAIAEDRLRLARRRAIESLARPTRDSINEQRDRGEDSEASNEQDHCRPVRERGLDIVANENPVRSNDGTSSGALAADRLRMARRKVLESMSKPVSDSTVDSEIDKPVKRREMDIAPHENSVIPNDDFSRDAVLEGVSNLSSDSTVKQHVSKADKPVKEHGLKIVAYENPVRSNDGTSSGALAADRLRMARRKVLESMSKSVAD
ncbi:hypothetical protein ACHAW6_005505 [Cyclotella cf. meneghiniana]